MGSDEKIILLAIFFLALLIVLFLDGIHTNTLTKRKIEKKIKQEKDLLIDLSINLNKFLYMQIKVNTEDEKKAIFKELMNIHKQMFKQHYAASEIISNKNLLFIDEFDAFYHFKLAFEVCKQLFDLNCQVFMSSHNTYLLTNDLLRPDCNFILQDNTIKPLQACTEKELRFAHNIEKIYRAGAFHVE